MIQGISYRLVNYLEDQGYIKEEKEVYLHGAKLFLSTMLGTLFVLLIGLITHHVVEAIIYEICMSSSRTIMGGYHCKSYTTCILTYVGLFLLGVLTLNIINFNTYTFIIIQICGIIMTYICSPVQSINKILSENKQKIFKRFSIIYITIYLFVLNSLYYFHNQYANIFLYIFMIINLLTVGGVIDYEISKE